jgi:maltose phosphorylase
LDLNTCTAVKNFRRELNMKEGWYIVLWSNASKRYPDSGQYSTFSFCVLDEVGIINYENSLNKDTKIIYYIDAGVTNEDANWDENSEPWGKNLRMKLCDRTFKTHFEATLCKIAF